MQPSKLYKGPVGLSVEAKPGIIRLIGSSGLLRSSARIPWTTWPSVLNNFFTLNHFKLTSQTCPIELEGSKSNNPNIFLHMWCPSRVQNGNGTHNFLSGRVLWLELKGPGFRSEYLQSPAAPHVKHQQPTKEGGLKLVNWLTRYSSNNSWPPTTPPIPTNLRVWHTAPMLVFVIVVGSVS